MEKTQHFSSECLLPPRGADKTGGNDVIQSTGQMVSSTLRPVGDLTLERRRRSGERQSGRPPYILEDQFQLFNSFTLLEVDILAPGVSSDPGSTPTAISCVRTPSTAQPVADQRELGLGTSSISQRIPTPSTATGTCTNLLPPPLSWTARR